MADRDDYDRRERGMGSLGAALVGMVIGAVAVALSNKETRKKIRNTLDDWMETGEEKLQQAKEKAEDVKERGRKKVVQELDRAKRKLEKEEA